MHITGMVHVNINRRDFDRSRPFYERLGFEVVWMVPETNAPEVAAAVGMPPYRVKGAIMAIPGADPPAELAAFGVTLVGPPATVMIDERHGTRFVCFRDPDGTFLELVERFALDPSIR